MAIPYHEQDYKLIKQRLQTKGELFTDNIFLPNYTSLGKLHHLVENITWKRPKVTIIVIRLYMYMYIVVIVVVIVVVVVVY